MLRRNSTAQRSEFPERANARALRLPYSPVRIFRSFLKQCRLVSSARRTPLSTGTFIMQSTLDQYRVTPYVTRMSHTIKNKSKLIGRVRRIKGQIEAVERALEAELGCADVLMLVASVRGAVNGLTAELLEDHIRHHVVDPAHEKDPEKAKGAADLIEVVRTYLKRSDDRTLPTAA